MYLSCLFSIYKSNQNYFTVSELFEHCCSFLFQNQRDQNYTVLKTKAHMMTVEGLKPGTTYVFRVRARTDGGYGSYGGEIELETSHEGDAFIFLKQFPFSFFVTFSLSLIHSIDGSLVAYRKSLGSPPQTSTNSIIVMLCWEF